MEPAAGSGSKAPPTSAPPPPTTALSPELQRAAVHIAAFPGACNLQSFEDVLQRPQLQVLQLLGELQRKGLVQVTITPTTALRQAAAQARQEQPALKAEAEVHFVEHMLQRLCKWSADFQTGSKWEAAFKAARERSRDIDRLLKTLTVAAARLRKDDAAVSISTSSSGGGGGGGGSAAAVHTAGCSSSGGREASNLQSVCSMATYLTSSVSHLLAALGKGDEFSKVCDSLQEAVRPRFRAPGVQLAYSIFNSRAMDSRLSMWKMQPAKVDGVQVLRLYLSYRIAKKEQPGHEAIAALEAWAGGLFLNGRVEEACARFSEALDLWHQLYGAEHPRVAAAAASVACCAAEEVNGPEAEALHRRALELQRKLLGERHPDVMSTQLHLARDLQFQGKPQEALDTYERCLAQRPPRGNLVWNPLPDMERYFPGMVGTIRHSAGLCAMQMGRYDSACGHLQRAIGALLDTMDHKGVDQATLDLGRAQQGLQEYVAAFDSFQQVHNERAKELGESHRDTLEALCYMADCYGCLGMHGEAADMFTKAVRLQRASGASDVEVAYALRGLGRALCQQAKFAEAEQALREALDLYWDAWVPAHDMAVARAASLLGVALFNQDRYEEAEAQHRAALHGSLVALGPDNAATAQSWAAVHGCVRQQLNEWADW